MQVYTYVRTYVHDPSASTATYTYVHCDLCPTPCEIFPGSCRCLNVLDSHMLLATDKSFVNRFQYL